MRGALSKERGHHDSWRGRRRGILRPVTAWTQRLYRRQRRTSDHDETRALGEGKPGEETSKEALGKRRFLHGRARSAKKPNYQKKNWYRRSW